MNNDFPRKKNPDGEDVLCAAVPTVLSGCLRHFLLSVCLFGGKDSTVLLHLTADVARGRSDRFLCIIH